MGDSMILQQNIVRDGIARTHVDKVVENLNEMRKAGINCDCSLEVTGYERTQSSHHTVHYAVVSAASDYCRYDSKCENGKWTIVLDLGYLPNKTEMVKEALEQCIEFMYIGKAEIKDDTAEWISELSHILKLKFLEDMGLKTMHHNLTTCHSCCKLLRKARYCERREYEAEAIKKWISLNLQRISGLNKCSPENLWRSTADLFENSPVFKYDCNVLEVLKLIEIEKADCKFLLDAVMINQNVAEDSEAVEYIFQSIGKMIERQPSNLNCRNYYTLKNLLNKYGDNNESELKIRLQKFMTNNFDVLAQQDGFLETNQDEVTSIFSSPRLTCTEKIKFDSMVKWVNHKQPHAEAFLELFKLIKLQNLSEEELINARGNPLVENNRELVLSVFDALAKKRETLSSQPLPVVSDTARWVEAQRPEGDNSSNPSTRSRSTSNGASSLATPISNFSTASLEESLLSLPTTTDSGADVDGDKTQK